MRRRAGIRLVGSTIMALLACSWIAAAALEPGAVVIQTDTQESALNYAAEELWHLLAMQNGFTKNADAGNPSWVFNIAKDTSLAPFSWHVSSRKNVSGNMQVDLHGHDAACALHAVYTWLEEIGYRFEITGPRVPDAPNLAAVEDWAVTIHPAVLRRGIRQHMNFPQDISSYPIEEAKQWVRNMARLRMNHITFHSYPGRLHTGRYSGALRYAGQTYDELLLIPDDPIFRRGIRFNDKYFRIPELEPLMDKGEERAAFMKQWCAALFDECKRAGLHVTLSFEPRLESMADSKAMVDDIMAAYPMIDTLELATNENGGGGEPAPEEMRRLLKESYDLAGYEEPVIAPLIAEPPSSMVEMLRELAHNIALSSYISEAYPGVAQSFQIYAIPFEFSQVAVWFMSRYVPKEHRIALMPQYGSRWVANRLEKFNIPAEALSRFLVYSWFEFDGMFFLQQNDVDGVRHLLDEAMLHYGQEPVYGISFNMWRTAENQITVRYGALASLEKPQSSESFYRDYALELGVQDVKTFAAALEKVDEAVEKARDTWNVGFAWAWMWVGWWNSTLRNWDQQTIENVHALYAEAEKLLDACLEGGVSEEGREYLRFVRNRTVCSQLHLEAVLEVKAIVPLLIDEAGEPVPADLVGEADQAKVLEACRRATYYSNKYMQTYAEILPDRGSEGALIIYNYCLPELIRKLRKEYGGDKEADFVPLQESDSWPVPAKWD